MLRQISLTSLLVSFFCGSALAKEQAYRATFKNKVNALKVEALNDEVLHFEWSALENIKALPVKESDFIWTSPMVDKSKSAGPHVWQVNNTGIQTEHYQIKVELQNLCFTVFGRDSGKALQTLCPTTELSEATAWKEFTLGLTSKSNLYGLGQNFRRAGTTDGDLSGTVWDPGKESMGHNLVGFSKGANSKVLFPILTILDEDAEAHALFLDSTDKQVWWLNQSPLKVGTAADHLRFYFIGGKNIQAVRSAYMDLTGKPPLPPKKIFGLWVSEFGYDSFEELQERVDRMEKNHFPVDGFALDIQWFGAKFYNRGDDTQDSQFGKLRFNSDRFPHPKQKIAELKKKGIDLMLIEESYISRFLPEHDTLEKAQYLAYECNNPKKAIYLDSNPWWGVGGMLDWTNKKAADYWHQEKRQPLIEMGIHAHWTDLGEPEMFSWPLDSQKPGEVQKKSCYHGFPELGRNQHPHVHNIYNFKWLESIARGYQKNAINVRPMLLSRAGTSGIARFGAGMWSGDIGANMGALTAHMNAQMHMSFSGIDYYGSDVGGFHRREDTLDGDQEELYTQWFANSSLFDFPIRPHVWNLSNKLETLPTSIGDKESNRFNLQQRYELAPYYYSLAYNATTYGTPVVAPMVYYFSKDLALRNVGHQKMVGPWLLAAVVASYGEKSRNVYLPKGEWYHYHTLTKVEGTGGGFLKNVSTNYESKFTLPLFVRAGAILPMQYVDEHTKNILGHGSRVGAHQRIRIFAGKAKTQFSLYEDDGVTYDYKEGESSLTKIEQQLVDNKWHIWVHAPKGEYLKKSAPWLFLELIQEKLEQSSIMLNGVELKHCPEGTPKESCVMKTHKNQLELAIIPAAHNQEKVIEVSLK